MEFCYEWEVKAYWLFENISDNDYLPVVCVEHKRYIPCRTCMYDAPATIQYSEDPADVEVVRKYQLRKD